MKRIVGILSDGLAVTIFGILLVTLFYRIPTTYFNGLGPSLPLAFMFFIPFLLAASVGVFSEWASRFSYSFFFAGVAIGVLIDVALDKTERNIYPIEIAFQCLILGPAIGFGFAFGSWLRKRFSRHWHPSEN